MKGVKNTKNIVSKDLKSQQKKNYTGIGNMKEKHWNRKKWLLANGMVEIKIVDSFNQYPTIYIYEFLNIKVKTKTLHWYLRYLVYFWKPSLYSIEICLIMGQTMFLKEGWFYSFSFKKLIFTNTKDCNRHPLSKWSRVFKNF